MEAQLKGNFASHQKPCFSGHTKPRVNKPRRERGGVVTRVIGISILQPAVPSNQYGILETFLKLLFPTLPPIFESFWRYFTYICGPSSYGSHGLFFISPVAYVEATDASHHWRCLHV